MKATIERPAFVTTEHLEYLDDLHDSGAVSMYGARPHLLTEFPELTKAEAASVLHYWMRTFPHERGQS